MAFLKKAKSAKIENTMVPPLVGEDAPELTVQPPDGTKGLGAALRRARERKRMANVEQMRRQATVPTAAIAQREIDNRKNPDASFLKMSKGGEARMDATSNRATNAGISRGAGLALRGIKFRGVK